MNNKKIHIFYSHYNITKTDNKNRPIWFDYEKCFLNLLSSIKNQNISLNIIMDGKISDNWISKYTQFYNSYEISGGNIENITKNCYSVINKYACAPDDIIYVLENDYLHTNDWVKHVQYLYQEFNNLSYISLYDHYDKYFLQMYNNLTSQIFVNSSHHWRTTPSTCGSYLTTKKILEEDYEDHIGNTIPVGDHHKWLFLNKTKNRFIITPIPGLSTHCMDGLLSPTIDWAAINNYDFCNYTNI